MKKVQTINQTDYFLARCKIDLSELVNLEWSTQNDKNFRFPPFSRIVDVSSNFILLA